MPIEVHDFWKIAVASGLFSNQECQRLAGQFGEQSGVAAATDARKLAEWMVALKALSRFQAAVLLSGRASRLVFGDYVIFDRVQKGRLAGLYRASHQKHKNVLLVLARTVAADPDSLQRLAAKTQAVARVESPCVHRVIELAQFPGQDLVVLEDLSGQSLRERLAQGPVPPLAAIRAGHALAAGLAAMHAQKIIHGGVWPENIWVEPDGAIKFLQFPLVIAPPDDEARQQSPAIDYLAPELAAPGAKETSATDLYALGCTIYELLAGRLPWVGDTPQQKLKNRESQAAPRLGSLVFGIPREVADVVAQLLAKQPSERPTSAAYVVKCLTPFASGTPQSSNATAEPSAAAADWEAPSSILAGRGPRTQRRISPAALLSGGIGLGLAATIVIAGWFLSSSDAPQAKSPSPVAATELASNEPSHEVQNEEGETAHTAEPAHDAEPSNQTSAASTTAAADDGQSLWISPTAGEPLPLDYLPSGAQVFVAVRLAELMADAEGARLLDVLNLGGHSPLVDVRAVVGVDLAKIEDLIVAFVPDDDGRPQAAFVARTRQAVPLPTLEEAWGRPPAAALQAKNYFRGSRWAYYLPPEAEGCAIVIGPPAVVEEILARDGPPLVRKGIEKLWHRSDRLRHFNLIVDPRYVWTDGLSLLVGDLERLHDPLARAFDDSIEAVLCSAHLGDELFLEVRVAGTVDNDPQKLADSLLARLRAGAEQIENYVSSFRAQPYGRMVLGRFPRMVQLLYNFTRAGAEGRQAVLRCYLPPA
ncbi:MAG TPA: protein kinase, partial [Pirellulales bacterium]|nr:protein kinase [Pirellulales bacterium]